MIQRRLDRPLCLLSAHRQPGTGAADLEWVEAFGLGSIYSSIVNRTREGTYNIALVELDGGRG